MSKQHIVPQSISSNKGHSINQQEDAMKMHQSDMMNSHSQMNSEMDRLPHNDSAGANRNRTGVEAEYQRLKNRTESMLLDNILNGVNDNHNIHVDNGSMVNISTDDGLSVDAATKADNFFNSKSPIPVMVTDGPSKNASQCINYTGYLFLIPVKLFCKQQPYCFPELGCF